MLWVFLNLFFKSFKNRSTVTYIPFRLSWLLNFIMKMAERIRYQAVRYQLRKNSIKNIMIYFLKNFFERGWGATPHRTSLDMPEKKIWRKYLTTFSYLSPSMQNFQVKKSNFKIKIKCQTCLFITYLNIYHAQYSCCVLYKNLQICYQLATFLSMWFNSLQSKKFTFQKEFD